MSEKLKKFPGFRKTKKISGILQENHTFLHLADYFSKYAVKQEWNKLYTLKRSEQEEEKDDEKNKRPWAWGK